MSKPNINIPLAFAVDGMKTDFTADKLQKGFNPIQPEVLSGDNLNKFIDDTYKGLNGVLELYKGCVLYDSTVTYTDKSLVFNITNDGTKFYHSLQNENINHALTDADYWEEVKLNSFGMPIGTIFPVLCSNSYIPNGALPLDGTEYTKEQFTDLWNNYLTAETPLLSTCTYTEYQTAISTYGSCAKFGIDLTNNKFLVPTIKDGDYITQAKSNDVLNKEYKESLPNIKATWNRQSNINVIGPTDTLTGAFKKGVNKTYKTFANSNSSENGSDLLFDTHEANSTYQDGAKVQGDNVRLRYFVQVSNGTISDSAMDWSAWASSLQGKANINLDNLSDTGKKVIDGQWVAKEQVLSTATAVGTYTIDLSDYLPNDNYNYEIYISIRGNTTSSSNADCCIYSSVLPVSSVNVEDSCCTARSSNADGNYIILPVNSAREITQVILNGKWSGLTVKCRGYRRIGTNE